MNDKLINMAIKPFLPQIKERAGESIKSWLGNLLTDAEKQLVDGEAYAAMVVVKNPQGDVFLLTCAMSCDDAIIRKLTAHKADEFTNQLLDKL